MYKFTRPKRFKRDIKRCIKQKKDMVKFKTIHNLLINRKALPEKNKDHALTNWGGCRECHITPDWLLIYRVDDEVKIIEYVRMGSHSELFNK